MNTIGRFVVRRLLGDGGQGSVFLCEDPQKPNTLVAVKRHDRGLSDRLIDGEYSVPKWVLPFAAPVLEVLPEHQAFVMPFYPVDRSQYFSLSELISPAQAALRGSQIAYCRILLRVAVYLLAADQGGLPLHGDLSPRNVLIDRDFLARKGVYSKSPDRLSLTGLINSPSPKLIAELKRLHPELCQDQGVVVIDPWVYDRSYDEQRVFGTSDFRAPEQQTATVDRCGISTDIYGFGAIFFSLFSGRTDRGAREQAIAYYNPSVPGQFEQIARACLQVDPGRRYKVEQLVQAMAWALAYLSGPDKFVFSRGVAELLPPRPTISKDIEREPSNTIRVMNRPLAIQNLSPRISSASERVRFECGAAEVRHYSVPEPVRQVADGWLMDRVKKAVAERTGNTAPFKFFDGGEVRLDTVDVCRSESPPEVIVNLTTSFTGYYRSRVTNEYCNRFLATGRTIFEEYGGRLRDLSDSVLSNPIAVSYLVVTSDGLVAVAKRANLANNAEKTPDVLLPLVVTVSGTCEPSKCCDEKGRFNLVEAVVAEYEEEVFRGHRLDPEQIHHLGIARTTGFLYPFVFGFITCGKTHEEVDGADRTTDDGIREIEGYEFIPNSVDGIIAKLEQIDNWRNPDNTRRRIEDSLLFCLSRYAHYLNLQTNQYSPDELDHRLNPQVKAGST